MQLCMLKSATCKT